MASVFERSCSLVNIIYIPCLCLFVIFIYRIWECYYCFSYLDCSLCSFIPLVRAIWVASRYSCIYTKLLWLGNIEVFGYLRCISVVILYIFNEHSTSNRLTWAECQCHFRLQQQSAAVFVMTHLNLELLWNTFQLEPTQETLLISHEWVCGFDDKPNVGCSGGFSRCAV